MPVCSMFSDAELRSLSTLVEMGYGRDQALGALLACQWDFDQTLEVLITGTCSGAPPDTGVPFTARAAPSVNDPTKCIHGCGHLKLASWSTCCRQCAGYMGPHTRPCTTRHRAQPAATSDPSRPTSASSSGAGVGAQPVPSGSPSVEPTEECPVCLEVRSLRAQIGGCRFHGICAGCRIEMAAAGLHACPVCRRSEETPGETFSVAASAPAAQSVFSGYVVLDAAQRRWLGLHLVDWQTLEHRLGIPRGQLSGRLSEWRISLRRVTTRAEANRWWRQQYSAEMPVFP